MFGTITNEHLSVPETDEWVGMDCAECGRRIVDQNEYDCYDGLCRKCYHKENKPKKQEEK